MFAKAVNTRKDLIVQQNVTVLTFITGQEFCIFYRLSLSFFFSSPAFAPITAFNLFKNSPTIFTLTSSFRVFAANCISINTIAVSLICIWTGATFWSGAPLLGWGSYTGLFHS